MKIIVTLDIGLDQQVWNDAYGHSETAIEIRDAVKDYARTLVEQDFENRGLVAKVTVR